MEVATLIALLEQYRYLILFPLACLEGPMLGFITGSLIPLGVFHPGPLLAVLVAADVVPDVAYYFAGRFGKRKNLVERVGHKVGLTPERFGMLEELWHTHTVKSMLITKFSYGLSTPLLVTAGLVHLPLRRFVALSALLALLQYSVLMALGYFFGHYFAQVESTLVRGQILVAAVVVVFVAYYLFTRSVRKRFWDNASE